MTPCRPARTPLIACLAASIVLMQGCGGGGDAAGTAVVGPAGGGASQAQLPVITAADLAASFAAAGIVGSTATAAPAGNASASTAPAAPTTATAPSTSAASPAASAPSSAAPTASASSPAAPAETAPAAAAAAAGQLHATNYRSVLADVLAQAALLQINLELAGDMIEVPPGTTSCSSGGTLNISFTDADSNGLPSLGDSYTAALTICRVTSPISGLITAFNGAVQGRLVAIQNSIDASAPYSVTFSARQDRLGYFTPTLHSISQPGEEIAFTRTRYNADRWTNSYGAGALELTIPPDGASTPVPSLRRVTVVSAVSSNDGVGASAFSLALDYVVSAVPFVSSNAALTVRTAAAWTSSSGAIVVTGADGSQARVERLGQDTWRTQLDTDGDGNFELTETGRPSYP